LNKITNFFVGDNSFWNVIIVFSILVSLIASIFIIVQVLDAKSYCDSVGGYYVVKFSTQPHQCNGEEIIKIDGKWDFRSNLELNWSIFRYNP